MNKSHSEHIKALPSEEFREWLETVAYHLCEHCTVDDRDQPICLYIYNMPAVCTIENCPYLEDLDR